MDIDANLAEQKRIVARAVNGDAYDAERLVDLVEAMHEWIEKGGALPAIWNRSKVQEPDPCPRCPDNGSYCRYC